MKRFCFVVLLYFACSCKRAENCPVEVAFAEKFQSSIKNILDSELGKNHDIDRKVDAILFLNAVTGIESGIQSLHTPVYDSREILKSDLRKWQEWYNSNKCIMTLSKADSMLKKYNSP
jgi:hypothetical protein